MNSLFWGASVSTQTKSLMPESEIRKICKKFDPRFLGQTKIKRFLLKKRKTLEYLNSEFQWKRVSSFQCLLLESMERGLAVRPVACGAREPGWVLLQILMGLLMNLCLNII